MTTPLITGDRGKSNVSASPSTPYCGRAASQIATGCKSPAPVLPVSVPVRVRQKGEISRPFHCRRQLALVVSFRSGYAARNNFAGFRYVCLEQVEILVIDLGNTLGGEAAVFSSA